MLVSQFLTIIFIGFGGMIGTISRYLISLVVSQQMLAILIVNVFGCLLAGFCYAYFPPKLLKQVFLIGFCGGFTTFSTFAMQNYQLIIEDNFIALFLYIFSSVIFAIIGFYLGIRLGSMFLN
jgi:CrcB protein